MEEESLEEIFALPPDIIAKLKDPTILIRYIEDGKTFQEILGYSEERMEAYYQKAKELFDRQAYEKAAEVFLFLTTLNPYVPSFWLGLGMSEELLHHFHEALRAYGMAIFTHPQDPLPHYHSATCYLALHDPTHARQSLELAVEAAKNNAHPLQSHAEEALVRLKNKHF